MSAHENAEPTPGDDALREAIEALRRPEQQFPSEYESVRDGAFNDALDAVLDLLERFAFEDIPEAHPRCVCPPDDPCDYHAAEPQDAARYRYLRDRLWVRPAKSLAGNTRASLQVAIARSFLPDGTPVAGNPDELDAAIDAARAARAAVEATP